MVIFIKKEKRNVRKHEQNSATGLLLRLVAGPVSIDSGNEKVGASPQLVESFDAIFDADPAIEANPTKFSKNGIKIVEPFSDFAVTKTRGISLRSGFFPSQIVESAADERPIAGVHCDNARRNACKQFERIITGKKCIAGIVIHTKVRVSHSSDQRTKDLHLLCKLRKFPEVIFVMVFENQRYAGSFRIWQTRFDGCGGQFDAFVD